MIDCFLNIDLICGFSVNDNFTGHSLDSSKEISMYSFDIFDTVITRRTAKPEGIFTLMQEIMKQHSGYEEISSYIKENFYVLRVGAEELARMDAYCNNQLEISLTDIYKALATTSGLTDEQIDLLMNFEINTELNNVLGNISVIDTIKKLKYEGYKVILISDMYLNKKNISGMLKRVDTLLGDLKIYVSSEYHATKSSGQLYHIVSEIENIKASDWKHTGDDEGSDIRAASKIGINVSHMKLPCWKPWELDFLNKKGDDFYWQLSLGTSRYVRLINDCAEPAVIGSSIGGPLLYPYVCWVLEESIKAGITRLYFIARDGWILKQIADLIINFRSYNISTYYCYGSRKAWRMPEFLDDKPQDKLLQYPDEIISIDAIAEELQVRKSELLSYFPWLPKVIKDSEAPLCGDMRKRVIKHIMENEDFIKFLCHIHSDRYEMAKRYIQQEIDVSDGNFAFVELSGTGLTQLCLARIMEDICKYEVRSFYLKMDRVQPVNNCKYFNFYPSNRRIGYIIELLCRAPHGQTEGYVCKNGNILPVLEDKEGKNIYKYGIEDYRDALLSYVEGMENAALCNQLSYGNRVDVTAEYMKLIGESGNKELMEYFGNMPFESEGRSKEARIFAPLLTRKQISEIYFWRWIEPIEMYYKGASLEYSLLRSGEKAKHYSERCEMLRGRHWALKIREKKWKRQQYSAFQIPKDILYYCPWDWFEGTVVLYGAGKVGKSFYRQYKKYYDKSYIRKKYGKCQKLIWVDANYNKYQNEKVKIESPEILRFIFFDKIIIAVKDEGLAVQIKNDLISFGINEKKIFWCYPVFK